AILLGSRIPVAPAPHVPWAKPYARGPIKLLIISTFGNAPIDVDQLAQTTRELQTDVRWVLVADAPVTYPDQADELYRTQYLPAQARAALREDYDVIVITFGTATPGHGAARAHAYFPDDVYQSILAKVQRGTGLLLVGQNQRGFWVDDTPLSAAAPARLNEGHWSLSGHAAALDTSSAPLLAETGFAAGPFTPSAPLVVYDWTPRPETTVLARADGHPVVMTRDHGQGRVVLLGWDGTLWPERHDATRATLEHDSAFALRALTYAARKEPPLQLAISTTQLTAGKPSPVEITTSAAAQVTWTLRDPEFHTLASGQLAARSGKQALPLPAQPTGRYDLDLIARDPRGRSLGWASASLQAEATQTLTLTTDRDVYHVGDTVHLRAALTDTSPDAAATGRLEVRDAAERLLLSRAVEVHGPALALDYAIADARVAEHVATLTLDHAGTPQLRAAATFFVPSSTWDDYENILWPAHPRTELNRTLRDEGGFTATFDKLGSEEASRAGDKLGMRAARLNEGSLSPGRIQTHPAQAATEHDALLAQAIGHARRYGALTWAFQDERALLADPGPPDAEGERRFRAYLQRHYRDLAALNTAWHTQHTSWNDVHPTLTAAVSQGTQHIAPWVDFRLYVADQAFEADKRHATQVHDALGPDVHVGLDGFTTSGQVLPYGALDFGRLASTGVFDFYAPYGDDLLLASLVRGPTARFMGWRMPRRDYFGLPWRDAFRGSWGSLRFFGPTFWSDFGWLQPAGRWTGESTRELREGIGKLLIGGARQLSSVAILYSYPSLITSTATPLLAGHGPMGELHAAAQRSRGLLEQSLLGSGVSFAYHTPDQVAGGSLRGSRVLFLPACMSFALSQPTAAAITRFVSEGGVVVGELLPGIFDEHGALHEDGTRGALDTLFGVTHGPFQVTQRERQYLAGVTGEDPLVPTGEWYVDEHYETTLRLRGGRALGAHVGDGTPAFVTHQTGRGRSLLLNFLLHATVPGQLTPDAAQYALFRRILAAAGVTSHAHVEATSGEPATHCEVNRFVDGDHEYIGVYAARDPVGDRNQVQLRFDTARETYDVRAGKYLGKLARVPLPLRASEAALYARLDQRITRLQLSATAAKRGEPLTAKLKLSATGPVGRHVIHVHVVRPDGTAERLYQRNVVVTDAGGGTLTLHTALSDPPGRWKIQARDVISGLRAETTVTLE
ncbi:MAG: beta-galactosidase trimerization domain-containing protein, partial [Polyangiales bacterium]